MHSGKRLPWVAAGILAALAIAGLVVRPWLDSVMTVKVTVTTDGAPSHVVLRISKLLTEHAKVSPVVAADLDLSRWAGKLIRVDIEGTVRRRWMRDAATGFVACEAELVRPQVTSPMEFVGWQQGPEIGMHIGPVGPQAFGLDPGGADRFVFATKGSLWHCIKTPESARLRLRLKPVFTSALEGALTPYVPSTGQDASSPVFPLSTPERPPDVFIYVIDALRADHLGCYGYPRGTSPAIDAFAADATVYENAYTPTTWTRPAVATMLTGLYASVHGAMHWSDGLAEWPVLLPEILTQAGYRTRCFVTNPNLSVPFGLDQGYDQFVYCNATADWVTTTVTSSLADEDPRRPVFMFLHTIEPHHPYVPSPESRRRFDRGVHGSWDGTAKWFERLNVLHPQVSKADLECMLDLYDAKVYQADQEVARFLAALKQAGRYDNSLVIVTADHGEAFAEHDTLIHAWDLNQETMRIPLLIHFPGGKYAGVRVRERASLIDFTPTVLSAAGVRPALPYRLPGRDLAAMALAPESGPSRRIYGEVARWDSNDVDLVAVIDEDGYKRVVDVSVLPRETAVKDTLGLWDTRADPQEKVNLAGKLPVRASYDEQLIARWLIEQRYWRGKSAVARAPQVDHDEAVGRHLKSLGYLGGALPQQDRSAQK